MSERLSKIARIRVEALSPEFEQAAKAMAMQLALPTTGDDEYALQIGPQGWQFSEQGAGAPGPIRADFVDGAVAHRRQFGGGSGQMIAKAVGIQAGIRPTILDATAGLGRDAFVLATLGCSVTLTERQPIIAVLLADALQRAAAHPDLVGIIARMKLIHTDAIELISGWRDTPPQVIYLDPMFPHRDKSALVKKEMRLFRPLAGDDDDAPALLEAALSLATHRVVVKRPRKAPAIDGVTPAYALEGKSSRYDIYPKKSLK